MTPFPLLDEPSRERLRRAAAALDAAEAGGQPQAVSLALARMAACYRSVREMASAEIHYEAALRWARSGGSTDQVVDLLCDLCETAAAVAEKVFMKASAALLPASSALPALKPNQPTHSSEAPTMVSGRLCGAMASLP